MNSIIYYKYEPTQIHSVFIWVTYPADFQSKLKIAVSYQSNLILLHNSFDKDQMMSLFSKE